MAVYVDDMHTKRAGLLVVRCRVLRMSHMIADTDDELHAMAALIGVDRGHFQRPGTPRRHYDVCLAMRKLAVAAGAIEITMRQASAMCRCRELGGELGTPATAIWRRNNLVDAMRAANKVTP